MKGDEKKVQLLVLNKYRTYIVRDFMDKETYGGHIYHCSFCRRLIYPHQLAIDGNGVMHLQEQWIKGEAYVCDSCFDNFSQEHIWRIIRKRGYYWTNDTHKLVVTLGDEPNAIKRCTKTSPSEKL